MKKIVLLLFFIFFILSPAKDINIGDSINLKISGISKEEITKAFNERNFSVEKISENKDGSFLVKVRGFNIGKNSIVIGDKNLEIDIKSVLTPEDKEIYKDLSDMSNKKLYLSKFPYIFVAGTVGVLLSFIFFIKTFKRIKKEEIIDYDNRFKTQMELLTKENWDFEISYALREYIDSRYSTHFINGEYIKKGILTDEDIEFIKWLDSCKFSKNILDEIENSKIKALDIYKRVKEGEINV